MTSFVLARDAKLGAPATTIALCPTMDLVVVACANGGTLTAFRLNWNKLWTKTLAPELETPTRATFRPDGKVLVVGYASGAITAHATEDGECLRVITGLEGFERDARDGASGTAAERDKGGEGGSDGCGITCLRWIDAREGAVVRDESRAARHGWNGARDGAREREGGASARFAGKRESWNEVGLVDHFESTGNFSALVAANESGVVAMHAFGMFRVGLWRDAFAKTGSVEALASRDDFTSVDAIVRDASRRKASFARLDAAYMAVHVREVYLVSTHAAHLKTSLERATIVLREASAKYEQGYKRRFDDQFEQFTDTLVMTEMYGEEMDVHFELRERLLMLLTTGTFDEALEHFFMTTFKTAHVKRMAKDVDVALTIVHEHLVSVVAPLMDDIMLRLNALLGLARLGYGSDGVGIDESRVEEVIKMCERFTFAVIDAGRVVTKRTMQLRAFFVYIIRAQIVAEDGDAHGAQLPSPRLHLVREYLDLAFGKKGISQDCLDYALSVRHERVHNGDGVFLRGAQPPLESMLPLNDALSDGEPLSLCEMLSRITREVNSALESPCDVLSAKCAWTYADVVQDDTEQSVFSNAEAVEARRESFHVDTLRDRVHMYRAFDGQCLRTATVTTPNELIVDACAYKGDSIALLLKPKDVMGGAKARLVLLDDDAFQALPRDGALVDLNSMQIRERVLPCVEPLAPLAVSANRGLASVLVGATRVQIYDLEDDGESDSDDDDE